MDLFHLPTRLLHRLSYTDRNAESEFGLAISSDDPILNISMPPLQFWCISVKTAGKLLRPPQPPPAGLPLASHWFLQDIHHLLASSHHFLDFNKDLKTSETGRAVIKHVPGQRYITIEKIEILRVYRYVVQGVSAITNSQECVLNLLSRFFFNFSVTYD